MKFKPRSFISTNGFEILVGRDARENSYLTHTLAAKSDIFFHVADFPGSHVILKANRAHPAQCCADDLTSCGSSTCPDLNQESPKPEDILDAALLAVHFSKAKKKIVKVDYTEVKNTAKPKGGEPGEVELTKFKSLKVERDEQRIKELLDLL